MFFNNSLMIMVWPVSWCMMSKNIFTKNFCMSHSQWNRVCCKYYQIIWMLKLLLELSQPSKKLWITWLGPFSSEDWSKIQLIMVWTGSMKQILTVFWLKLSIKHWLHWTSKCSSSPKKLMKNNFLSMDFIFKFSGALCASRIFAILGNMM